MSKDVTVDVFLLYIGGWLEFKGWLCKQNCDYDFSPSQWCSSIYATVPKHAWRRSALLSIHLYFWGATLSLISIFFIWNRRVGYICIGTFIQRVYYNQSKWNWVTYLITSLILSGRDLTQPALIHHLVQTRIGSTKLYLFRTTMNIPRRAKKYRETKGFLSSLPHLNPSRWSLSQVTMLVIHQVMQKVW